MKNTLESGNYMFTTKVIDYCNNEYGNPMLAAVMDTLKCQTLVNGSTVIDTKDIMRVVDRDIFREMECHVVTYMVGIK